MIQNDILDRLWIDPGQRTLGQLLQDREAAAHEIRKLQGEIKRLRAMRGRKQSGAEAAPKLATTERGFPAGALIRIGEVCDFVGVCRTTIYRWVSEGTFPPPARISERAVRWRVNDIEAWRDAL